MARNALFDGDFVSKTIAPIQCRFSFGREEARQALLRPKSLTNLRFANESARPLANLTICGQRSGRECIFTANASVCSAKNARNDVHAVISDESLVLPRLCQYSEALLRPKLNLTRAVDCAKLL